MLEKHFSLIDSTNTWAKLHVHELDPLKITCIHAEEQTQGRGRFSRKWISPKGKNLYLTFYFQLSRETKDLMSLGQMATLSLATVLQSFSLSPTIKWPNDLLLNKKKCAGVLCEAQISPSSPIDLFVGIGLNVNMDREEIKKLPNQATSLFLETGEIWDRKKLLKKLQVQFEKDLQLFREEGFTPFYDPFITLLSSLGKRVECFDGVNLYQGIADSLTPQGELILLLDSGEKKIMTAGELRSSG